jgi:membrane associated rhomboid family serine protease
MFPIADINPTRRVPYVTWIFIGINIIVFLSQLGMSQEQLFNTYVNDAIVPALVTRDPFSLETFLDFIRSMFFHGGWAHILGNMLYLWIFGDNIEDRFGKVLYIVFYLLCGFVAGIAQIVIDPTSRIPLVGASGAIAGVLGAYLIMFPGIRVRGLLLLGVFTQFTEFPAIVVLGFWFVTQLFSGVASLGVETATGGVAFFAHIGGFVAGVVLAWLFTRMVPQPSAPERVEWAHQRRNASRRW